MILTDCRCGELAIYPGEFPAIQVEHVATELAARARIAELKRLDRGRISRGEDARRWAVHLRGRHCTEGPA